MSRFIYNRSEYENGSKWFADWHRHPDHEYGAKAIDIDLAGYCPRCKDIVYLVEATHGVMRKTATVLEHLGRQLEVPVWVVYEDETGARPGKILVHERQPVDVNRGWLPEAQVWRMLGEIRASHRCAPAQEGVA